MSDLELLTVGRVSTDLYAEQLDPRRPIELDVRAIEVVDEGRVVVGIRRQRRKELPNARILEGGARVEPPTRDPLVEEAR